MAKLNGSCKCGEKINIDTYHGEWKCPSCGVKMVYSYDQKAETYTLKYEGDIFGLEAQ